MCRCAASESEKLPCCLLSFGPAETNSDAKPIPTKESPSLRLHFSVIHFIFHHNSSMSLVHARLYGKHTHHHCHATARSTMARDALPIRRKRRMAEVCSESWSHFNDSLSRIVTPRWDDIKLLSIDPSSRYRSRDRRTSMMREASFCLTSPIRYFYTTALYTGLLPSSGTVQEPY